MIMSVSEGVLGGTAHFYTAIFACRISGWRMWQASNNCIGPWIQAD